MNSEIDPTCKQLARSENSISVQNANTHNLKNVSLEIPRDQLVVITGRSGSGKSSLAIDTIFAEGQRQYIESLSLYSRQFFKQLPKADVDLISGLPPTLCLDQRHGVSNRRSTVGTITETYHFLRLLMARVGKIHCSQCGKPIFHQTPQQIRDRLLELPERTKIMILTPVTHQESGDHKTVLRNIRRERMVRVRIDGEVMDIDQIPELHPKTKHTIEAVTDRIIIRDGVAGRLLEAIEFAERMSDGKVIVSSLNPGESSDQWTEESFSTRYACAYCDIQFSEIQARTFSFNSPQGACDQCQGLGLITEFDPHRVVADRSKSLADDPIVPWNGLTKAVRKKWMAELDPIIDHLQWDFSQALFGMTEPQWHEFLFSKTKQRPGLLTLLAKEMATTSDVDREDELLEYQATIECPNCHGCRLNETARSVFISGKHIGEIVDLPIERAIAFFDSLELNDDETLIAEPIVKEINSRLRFLDNVGVGYLSIGRSGNTLSGGEHQRVRLATSIGSGLTNVCYVLDEPSIGLHQRDNDRLIDSIRNLQHSGNTVLLVEHDEATIRAADHVIDVGPESGLNGGRIIATGTPNEICDVAESLTGDYLAGRRKIETPKNRRPFDSNCVITIKGASGRNLQSIDTEIPLGILACVTGVSGSGKSTLINQTLAPAIKRNLDLLAPTPQPHESISGLDAIERLILVDQKPIGKSSRGCPATVMGIFDNLRKIFAATKKAKQLGFGRSRFSFNTKSGWCTECRGHGVKKIEMNFMPDFHVTCDVCAGRRFNLQTLSVKFNSLSIADVLFMSVDQARRFFDGIEIIARPLQSLIDVGLGYLKLGQSTVTLSGGESQRLKLAAEISKKQMGNTLYILDEPTTGLHFEDIRVLLSALNRIVDRGNSMIVIEHNLDVIRCADWIIDLGPEGGEQGGQVMATGTPEDVARVDGSYTGKYLAELLG